MGSCMQPQRYHIFPRKVETLHDIDGGRYLTQWFLCCNLLLMAYALCDLSQQLERMRNGCYEIYLLSGVIRTVESSKLGAVEVQ